MLPQKFSLTMLVCCTLLLALPSTGQNHRTPCRQRAEIVAVAIPKKMFRLRLFFAPRRDSTGSTKSRKYDLQMKNAPLNNLGQYDCVLIVTDHSDYNYARMVRQSKLVVDRRNATRCITAPNIVRC